MLVRQMHTLLLCTGIVLLTSGKSSAGAGSETERSVAKDPSSPEECLTEKDLNSETCNVEDLPIPALKAICDRVGLDVEKDVFPYLFLEIDSEGTINKQKSGDLTAKDMTHSDYVSGAYECLQIEQEFWDEDPNGIATENALEEDVELLADDIAELLMMQPELVKDLEDEIKRDEPGLWDLIQLELEDGETLADREDILIELLIILIKEDADIFDRLFEGIEDDTDFESEL